MTPERWRQVREIFHAALEYEPGGRRDSFIEEACGGDSELRLDVESLLAADEGDAGLLDGHLGEAAAELLGGGRGGLEAGRALGHYRVERELGRGGMGEVYLAADERLGRRVALKLLSGTFAADTERVARFEREARAASALNHPNIVTIHEVGEAEGLRFIVTEYVEGETLRDLLARGPVAPDRALDIAAQVASALAAAHEAGVLHRDVKPENVMLRPDGFVKVLDFGLAKMSESAGAGGGEAATLIKLSTQPGLVMGTVTYMSPEQARGQKVDARTDVWSLGVVLYEMLAARAPFDGETMSDVLASILTKEPAPLTEFAPDAPEELTRVVARALRKERAERHASMREMLDELRAAREEIVLRSHLSGGAQAGRVSAANAVGVTPPLEGQTPGLARAAGRIPRRKAFALTALAAFVALAGAAALYLRSGREDSLAVLPFVYVAAEPGAANDPEREYLSDGLTESIIRDLSRLSDLRVIARSSVFRYKGRESDPREVGRELRVRTVLTGRIAQRGDRLTVSAELVEAETGTRLWGDRYEAGVTDLLRVQDEIAEQISRQLRLRLTEGERRRQLARQHTPDPEAHRLYLKGRYYWNLRTAGDLRKAVETFRAAVEKDPDYALAYAGLSDAYSLLPLYTDAETGPTVAQAREAALKSLEKDEGLAEGHTALAYVLGWYDWKQLQARQSLARAIHLNPNYATAHHRLGLLLAESGHFDVANQELRRARDLDPVSSSITTALATSLYFAGRYDEAIDLLKQVIEMNPGGPGAHSHLGDVYREQGRYAEAIEEYRQDAALRGGENPAITSRMGVAYARAGDRAEALRLLEELMRTGGDREFYAIAAVHAALGDKEQALAWLGRSIESRHQEVTRLKVDPQFESLRSDPRFQEMVRRVGMDQ